MSIKKVLLNIILEDLILRGTLCAFTFATSKSIINFANTHRCVWYKIAINLKIHSGNSLKNAFILCTFHICNEAIWIYLHEWWGIETLSLPGYIFYNAIQTTLERNCFLINLPRRADMQRKKCLLLFWSSRVKELPCHTVKLRFDLWSKSRFSFLSLRTEAGWLN